MVGLRSLLSLDPVATTGRSAATYVPWVMVARGLAFVRTLVVAHLLGKAGQAAFGLYQPALEIINPLVALVMFGSADVAERYVSRIARDRGAGGVRQWLVRQWLRLALIGMGAAAVLTALAPWISPVIWGSPQVMLLTLCAVLVVALALYQHVAATLRGLRAYGAAAGMEVMGAALLLAGSAAVAFRRDASWLMAAYLVSVLVPLVAYGMALSGHLRQLAGTAVGTESEGGAGVLAGGAAVPRRFGTWAALRLMLVLVFGFLSLWGLLAIEGARYVPADTAQFSMPWRIAQLVGFLAVTGWASAYGIAARAWSQGQVRRAKAQYFRVGRLGMGGLMLLAVVMLPARFAFVWILPTYAGAIEQFLPPMLAVFIGYALLTFLSSYGDLNEKPWKGALLWAVAIAIQATGIIWGRLQGSSAAGAGGLGSTASWLIAWSAGGLAVALGVAVPLVCRPLTARAGLPLVIFGVAAGGLLVPVYVDWIAGPGVAVVLLMLYFRGWLVRPYDWRAMRRAFAGRSLHGR